VFVLLTWSLSTTFFPYFFPGFTQVGYWITGVIASLLLFVSVLLHELSHSLVARARNIRVESITLFFFGGVAGITKEDIKPLSEFLMAIAGPLFSFLLAGIFYLVFTFNGPGMINAISFYLYQLNLILAIFNLVPAFPLDGGRAFRAVLYYYYKDLKKATKIASTGGKIFGGLLIALGLISFLGGVGNGLWFLFLGGFLYFIAGMSYEQVVLRDVLHQFKVGELMQTNIVKLKPEMKFAEFTKKYAKAGKNIFLVTSKNFTGILDINSIRKMPKKMQDVLKIKQLALPVHNMKTLHVDDNAYKAFKLFSTQKISMLPVIEGKKIKGVVTQAAVMNRFMWEMKFGK